MSESNLGRSLIRQGSDWKMAKYDDVVLYGSHVKKCEKTLISCIVMALSYVYSPPKIGEDMIVGDVFQMDWNHNIESMGYMIFGTIRF